LDDVPFPFRPSVLVTEIADSDNRGNLPDLSLIFKGKLDQVKESGRVRDEDGPLNFAITI